MQGGEQITSDMAHIFYSLANVGISGTSAIEEAIRFACSESFPCQNIAMADIDIRLTSGDAASSFCENVQGFSMGFVIPPSCFEDYADYGGKLHQGRDRIIAQAFNPQPKDEL